MCLGVGCLDPWEKSYEVMLLCSYVGFGLGLRLMQ